MKKILLCALALALLCVSALAEGAPAQQTILIDGGDHQIPATVCLPEGDGPFPALVMLHGTGSNRDEAGGGYAVAAPILAEDYGIATIRIDFMGNGESTASYEGYTFASAVGDAVAAAEHLASLPQIDKARIGVMGWSQGGTDALLSAGRHPERFSCVVTWAGAPDLSDGEDMINDALYAEAKANGFFVMNFDWRDPLHVSLQWCEDVLNTDVLAEFAAFPGPVLAIAGKDDTTVNPEWSQKIREASPNERSAVYLIEGMDHTFNVFTEEDLHSLKDAIRATGEFVQGAM